MVGIQYAPSAALVGQAGYQGGIGDYKRWATGIGVQQKQQELQNTMNLRDLAQNTWQTQYGGQLQTNLQNQSIANQQLQQARSIAANEYMQQQGFGNSNLQQLRQIGAGLYQQQVGLVGQASLAAQNAQYGQQSQILSGQLHAGLQAQNALMESGLSSQRFDQTALLQSAQAQNQIAINRAGLQDQLTFIPQISEAQFSAQQQKLGSQMSALDAAFSGGQINDAEYQQAHQDLLGQMLGLQKQMPSRSDAFTQYQKMTFTPYTDQIDPATGQPIPQFDQYGREITVPRDPITNQPYRYQLNRDGTVSLDEATKINVQRMHYEGAIRQRAQADAAAQMFDISKAAMEQTQKLASTSVTPMSPEQIDSTYQRIYENMLFTTAPPIDPRTNKPFPSLEAWRNYKKLTSGAA